MNRIAHARRFDRTGGASWELAVEQRYLYDASNQRTVKTTTFRGAESGTERTALYVYPGDFERRGLQTTFDRTSYEAISGDTETQYGVGGARIVWRTSTRDDGLDRDQRITLALTDLIQSTTAVIDLATGEIVETGGYYANGARARYRSNESETVAPEPMGFTGKEADEEVGLTYFGHRYLMAHLGRWASPDPLQTHAVGGGEAVNGYHYVSGSLLQARDPLGLVADPTVTAVDVHGAPTEVTIRMEIGVAVENAKDRASIQAVAEAGAAWWNGQSFRGRFAGHENVLLRFDVRVRTLSDAEVQAAGGYAPRELRGEARAAYCRGMSGRTGLNIVGDDPSGEHGDHRSRTDFGGGVGFTLESVYNSTPAERRFTGAHEIGHLLGLGDTYREDCVRGEWDNSVMGRRFGVGLTGDQQWLLARFASLGHQAGSSGATVHQRVRHYEGGMIASDYSRVPGGAYWGHSTPGFLRRFRDLEGALDDRCRRYPYRSHDSQ